MPEQLDSTPLQPRIQILNQYLTYISCEWTSLLEYQVLRHPRTSKTAEYLTYTLLLYFQASVKGYYHGFVVQEQPLLLNKMINFLLLILASPLLSPAMTLESRAGAPIPKPIPSTCGITNLLSTSSAFFLPESYTPVRPKDTTLGSPPSLYAYYLPPDSTADPSLERCLETCYAYGNIGDCTSVYFSANYPPPSLYGAPPGPPSTACILFTNVTIADFEIVPEAERANYTSTAVRSMSCPPQRV
jgi:hypothetical protein